MMESDRSNFRSRPRACWRGSALLAVLLLAAGYPSPLTAGVEEVRAKVIAGWVERVSLRAIGRTTKAKLDTGAKTSALHASNIEEFEKDGDRWVRFDLFSHPREPSQPGEPGVVRIERRRVRGVLIKDHDDPSDPRPVVELEVCFDGRIRKAQFSLVDRSNFLYPMLLGRRFLGGTVVVDPDATFLTDPGCPAEAKPDWQPVE